MTIFSFVIYPFVWYLVYYFKSDKKAASRYAADVTMVFLIGVVASLYDQLFHPQLNGIWIIILFLLLLAGFIGNVQNRLRGQIDIWKIARAVWRLGFLVLAFLYVLFFLIVIIKLIINL